MKTPRAARHWTLILVPALVATGARAGTIPAAAAEAAFAQKHALCARDAGRMWGKSLCGPTMFVDAPSRAAVLDTAVPGARREGSIYRVTLPGDIPIANTAVDYAGKRWSMVLWPLPDDAAKRAVLLMHESYHVIQPALGLTGEGGLGTNGHLDRESGRIWLRAEFHALRAALEAKGKARQEALADALRFRAYRRSLWPEAARQEDGLELNEGLAESTGIDVALADPAARIRAAIADIDTNEAQPSYVRSFAYATGPAYAELLDAAAPDWRHHIRKPFDFGAAAAAAYHIGVRTPDRRAAMSLLQHYGGATILAEEGKRARDIAERNRRYTAEFLDGPTLTLPLAHMSISFDPRNVTSFTGHGSVYSTLTLSDDWGRLVVTAEGALINPDFNAVTIPVDARTCPPKLSGKGWTLDLAPGFGVAGSPDKPHAYRVVGQSSNRCVDPGTAGGG